MFWDKKDRQIKELKECVQKLQEENAYLKFKLLEFQDKAFKRKKKRRDDDDNSGKPQPKKLGAPKGHTGWFRRKPKHIDYTEEVSLKKCPKRGSKELKDLLEE